MQSLDETRLVIRDLEPAKTVVRARFPLESQPSVAEVAPNGPEFPIFEAESEIPGSPTIHFR